MTLIDIGANLTSKRFRHDLDAVISRALSAKVSRMIVTGTSLAGSTNAHELARARRGTLFATAGVHPHNAKTCHRHTLDELRSLARAEPVVAIGECGLDYDRNFSPPEVQRRWFAAQLELAEEVRMPVFLHERAAHRDFLAILRDHPGAALRAVVHCFTGTAAELDAYLSLGVHVGITGWINDDRRGKHLRALVPRIPSNRLMIETDAPFLLPRDMPAPPEDRRNEPAFLPYVLNRVASCVGKDAETVAAETTAAAVELFGLSRSG